ncbi:MAG: hypothetical protein SOY98_00415 [Candidatus Cryptobacteroides sp.]|nr:efflux RND transporter permease subunit [Bacteroidales bacterium]MDY3962759.1 hypothetical protein [Candidatus Cryptobacteroides sp.]
MLFIYAAGFSLNLLTLFAIVLVIGTVVDNATVDALGGLTPARSPCSS